MVKREFLARHPAREEEVLRLLVEALDHVLLGRVVFVAGGNGVAIDLERRKEREHLFDLLHLGLFIDSRVRGDLVAQQLGHANGCDTFLEDAFPLDDEVVSVFEAVDVDVPVHPLGRLDGGAAVGFSFADGLGVLVGDQLFREQFCQRRLQFRAISARQVVLHLFAHEHAVGADINDAALRQEAGDQFLELGVNQRFAAADRHHRRVAFLRGLQAILQAHHVLEVGGILADAPTAGAGQIAGVERFKLQHQRKLRRAEQFVFNYVPGDLRRQREGESHIV